jgi:hypothetical protein
MINRLGLFCFGLSFFMAAPSYGGHITPEILKAIQEGLPALREELDQINHPQQKCQILNRFAKKIVRQHRDLSLAYFDHLLKKEIIAQIKVMSVQVPIPSSYSINLMWINKTLNPSQKYLLSAKDDDDLKEKLLNPVIKWAVSNPTAEVNLWYDSVFVNENALRSTEDILKAQLKEKGLQNVSLRDVREIPIVEANPDAFSDHTPVYYRVDMLKPIIIVHSIESEKKDAAIFSDLEVGDRRPNQDRMGKDELFKPSVMKKLSTAGLVLNKSHFRNENQFLQLVNNPRMISAIKHVIINANLLRAETALNHPEKKYFIPALNRPVYPSTQQEVFYYYYDLIASEKVIKVRPDVIGEGSKMDPWVDYDPEKHGYLPLGNIRSSRSETPLVLYNGELMGRSQVIKGLSLDYETIGPARNVHVRNGNDHPPSLSEFQPPLEGKIYRVQFWK